MVYSEQAADHAATREREKYLKSTTGRRWLAAMLADAESGLAGGVP